MSPDADAPTKDEADEAPASDEAPTTEDTDVDETLASMRDRLVAELGDAVVDSELGVGRSLWVRVTPDAWRTAGQVARDLLGCRWFDFLSAIDWLPSPYGRYEDDGFVLPEPADPASFQTGITGGDSRFQLLARVVDLSDASGVILKSDVGEDLTMPSWVPLYDGADWHERETWEMFGITFDGHPGLRHIYLPGDFEGYPLRKDFPLIARIVKPWPGIVDVEPMPEETVEDQPQEATADGGAEAPTEGADP